MSTPKDKCIYLITDTSWWLDQGWLIATSMATQLDGRKKFFVIPSGVMRELDGLKRNPVKRKKALEATKQINMLISIGKGKITKGDNSIKGFLSSPVDEEVISVAKKWKKEGKRVILLSTDYAQMALGKNEGIPSVSNIDHLIKSMSQHSISSEVFLKKENQHLSLVAIILLLTFTFLFMFLFLLLSGPR